MIRADRLLIIVAIAAVLGLFVWGLTAGGYPRNANVFPGLAVGGMLVFGVLALREGLPKEEDGAFSVGAALWLLAVLPVVYLFGFRIGLPLYALVFVLARQTRVPVALLLALGVAAVIELLFIRVLHLALDWGWLLETAL